jgi:nucleoside permease NupC
MGVNVKDITLVGQLLGEKIILNEMIGYASLKGLISSGAFYDQKSIISGGVCPLRLCQLCLGWYSDRWYQRDSPEPA